MGDQYGSPLPLAAVAAEPSPTMVWALTRDGVRVHVAWSGDEDTFCGLIITERKDRVGPAFLFCDSCREAAGRVR